MKLRNLLPILFLGLLGSGCASLSLPTDIVTDEWCQPNFMECIEVPVQEELPI